MIIDTISIKNFQCYYGDGNSFSFKSGVNIIIGENGAGKSKLWDAFYWVLWDQIFQSDQRRFVPTKAYGEHLFSMRAKAETEVGDTLECSVSMIVKGLGGKSYMAKRAYRAKKVGEDEWQPEAESRLMISEKKRSKWEAVATAAHQSVLNRVIPSHLKPYMWFQGEAVESLMDLQDQSSLMRVIDLLSDIKIFDDLIEITDRGKQGAESGFNKEAKKHSTDVKTSERLGKELEKLQKEVSRTKSDLAEAEKEESAATVEFDKLLASVGDAEARVEGNKQRKAKREDRQRLIDEEERLLTGLTERILSDNWVFLGLQDVISKFAEKYESYYGAHLLRKQSVTPNLSPLPANIPEPIHLNRMLNDEHCHVCDRPAEKGSEAYKHIEGRLGGTPVSVEEDLFVTDCSEYFQRLSRNQLTLQASIEGIRERISDVIDRKDTLRAQIDKLDQDIDSLGMPTSDASADDSQVIISSFKEHQRRMKSAAARIATNQGLLSEQNSEIQEIQNKLEKLAGGKIDTSKTLAKEIWEKLARACSQMRKEQFQELVSELENSANGILREMTEGNDSARGLLRLQTQGGKSCAPEIVDIDGNTIVGANDSFLQLTRLAIIMAILTMRNKWSDNYSLVADAPTSKMAERLSNGFYTALSSKFTQSIVITYDFLKEDQRDFLKTINTGAIYRIRPNTGGVREDLTRLSIDIEEISL